MSNGGNIMERNYRFNGKVAVVTGGGKGIGKAIALGMAECGVKVVVTARTEVEIKAVAEEITEKGGEATYVVTDLTQKDQLDRLVAATLDTYQQIDFLVNNAARSFMRPLMELREDGFDKIFDTNVKAVFLLSRLVAGHMKGQGGGKIVNISTVGAVRGGAGMGIYHSSKAALNMLTKCMAVEWAPFGIAVNAVGPGFTRTEFSKPIWTNPEINQQIPQRVPLGRIGEPEEMVGAVLFLCSEDASYMTGGCIYVDGGSLAN